jgi:hypothetical protein
MNSLRMVVRRASALLTIVLAAGALSACSDVLDVDLPSSLTDEALSDPTGAETLRNSVIGEFEAGFSQFVWEFYSREDGGGTLLSSPGVDRFGASYERDPGPWFGFFASARRFAQILHDKLEKDWTAAQVPERQRYMAITSMYGGAALALQGAVTCEVAVDAGPLMSPTATLTLAETWLTRALAEIAAVPGGDFAMPYGIASSAKNMALGLRAQVRWMKGDKPGALADAALVPRGFVAWVTRDMGPARRNQAYWDGPNFRFARLLETHDWWQGSPNPVTGRAWPAVLPFTGYVGLGILADGRAVRDDGLPIRTTGKYRTPAEDAAVPDARVPYFAGFVQGLGTQTFIHNKYRAEDQDIPVVNWREMFLIRAEIEGGQRAIDLVNELRAADNLPRVTYANPGNAEQIRSMVIEERRRALFVEGRYYPTKLKNMDILWFPRNEGKNPTRNDSQYGDAIRLLMPGSEYTLNPNLTDAARGTGCPASEKPTNIV